MGRYAGAVISKRTNLSHAERQIILISAGTAGRRQAKREQVLDLTARIGWKHLAGSLQQRRLLPTLGPRIVELADRPDAGFVAHVEESVEVSRRQGAFLELISARLGSALAEAGIRSFPLKGPKLSELLYGDPGRRLASDIDLLVAADQLDSAVAVVRGLGYGAPIDHVDESGLPQLHLALAHQAEELPPVELHWRIHWYERSFAEDRLLPPTLSASEEWRPAAATEIAALLLFYARDGFVDLRLASDVASWWDVRGAEVSAEDFAELVRSYPSLRRPLLAAAAAAERIVGLPVAGLVEKAPGLDLRGRMAVRLANPNPNPRSRLSQFHATMGLVDGLLMPSGELGDFVRRQLLLPPDVLVEQAQKLERSPRSQLSHGARTLARIGVAATRLARAPEAVH
jgi:Uncharacterised nucleotidyltransferase